VEDTEAAAQREQEDMKKAENAGLTNRELEQTVQEMMVGIGDSLSDLSSYDIGEDGDNDGDEDT